MNYLFLLSSLALSLIQAQDIPNQYIVTFKGLARFGFDAQVSLLEDSFVTRDGSNQVRKQYPTVLNGVSARLDAATLDQVKNLPFVDKVYQDQVVKVAAIQKNAPYGLARIATRNKLTNETQSTYKYYAHAGNGVTVYVLDTGINVDHVDFEGRASWGYNAVEGSQDKDIHGHGTHCAGTVASKTYGVAKKAKVVAVKVLGDNGNGSWEGIIDGIEWVVKDAGHKPHLISMSIWGGQFQPVDDAVNSAYEKGTLSVICAGNGNDDACRYSPGSASSGLTVGATDINDNKAGFSNYGKCVNILGPGVSVLSTYNTNNTATRVMSGTSMSTPHVAGVAATLLSQGIAFEGLKQKIFELSTKDAITGFNKETVNHLLYAGYEDFQRRTSDE